MGGFHSTQGIALKSDIGSDGILKRGYEETGNEESTGVDRTVESNAGDPNVWQQTSVYGQRRSKYCYEAATDIYSPCYQQGKSYK